jgi:hypothetical protein
MIDARGRGGMGLLDGIEKLITEHGSASILRERIAFAREQYSALESRVSELQRENERLNSANASLHARIRDLEQQLSQMEARNASAQACDHCGSTRLKRVGNRPDPTFGDLGVIAPGKAWERGIEAERRERGCGLPPIPRAALA